MHIENKNPLVTHHQTITLSRARAKTLSRRAQEKVFPGDELRVYLGADGSQAEAILSPREQRAAVRFPYSEDFLWGVLQELGDRRVLVGDGDPFVVIDLADLAFTLHRVD